MNGFSQVSILPLCNGQICQHIAYCALTEAGRSGTKLD